VGSHVIDKVYGKLNKNIKVCVKVKILFIVFFFPTGATTHSGFVFCSPLSGYSLLAYEVS